MKVSLGSRVEVDLLTRSGESERLVFELVPDQAADLARGFLGLGTPLAKAIFGKPAGARIPYTVGDMQAVQIIDVTAGEASAEALAARRQAEAESIVRQISQTTAANFAASFSGKWGDYDPDGVAKWTEDPTQPGDNENGR